ncbi:hypothetical protein LIER_06878 [Lithospermum erythrorhizon]|uniref:RING-type E3 ubiquitin transferase n=1 Tax=Lithospermum erythrorhizon TaxID=34254 RepID=A0AAV3P7J0_LITER
MSMAASSSSSGVQIVDDFILKELTTEEEYDACSICFEPFSDTDPSTVTGCKHEYHLHCILEWSQRSKECPICWQFLALKDPASQELLVAAGTERDSRLSGNVHQIHEVHEMPPEAPYRNDYDYEEEYYRRLYRDRYTSSPQSSSVTSADMSNMHQTSNLQGECPIIGDRYRVHISTSSGNVNIRDHLLKPSSPSIDGSRRSSSSELLAISNSIRSKIFAASTRCKESLSKGTSGFKEKLLARNTTVKELSREVQREMNAGIAGVAKMIERIDLSSKRSGASTLVSSCKVETSNMENKGKAVQDDTLARAPGQTIVLSTEMSSSDSSPLTSKNHF